jgi:putative ABC transport system permease protein
MCSVALALFLFASLRTVVTTLNAGSQVSSASRMITQNSTAFVIPLPMSYAQRLKSGAARAGRDVGQLVRRQVRRRQEVLRPVRDRSRVVSPHLSRDPGSRGPEAGVPQGASAALVGAKLLRDFGWKVGDNVTLQGTIFPATGRSRSAASTRRR